MTIAAQYPSAYNVFVPNASATNNLIVDFARNPDEFSINKYIQVVKSERNTGLYTKMTNEVCARYMNDGKGSAWAYGTERDKGYHNLESFKMEMYRTFRWQRSVTLDHDTIKQAAWNITDQYNRILAAQAMTARTMQVIETMTNPDNYAGVTGHVVDVNATEGLGFWDTSITANLWIKKAINMARTTIRKDTLGNVQSKDLVMVMGPDVAQALSESQEIVDYIKASPDALRQVEGKLGGGEYGLPAQLYGIPVIVEDCTIVTSPKGAPRATQFAFPAGTCAIVSRPGGLVGASGGPNFSTVVLFAKEEMTTESFDMPKDRYTQLSITEDYVAELVAPVSGVLLTNLLSTNAA
ncbi:MAG: hypothetical protein J6W10_04040 [Kiritimatiellae bacterium]|nr:hypothetical protein [Kiritimatiellia bacterium]